MQYAHTKTYIISRGVSTSTYSRQRVQACIEFSCGTLLCCLAVERFSSSSHSCVYHIHIIVPPPPRPIMSISIHGPPQRRSGQVQGARWQSQHSSVGRTCFALCKGSSLPHATFLLVPVAGRAHDHLLLAAAGLLSRKFAGL